MKVWITKYALTTGVMVADVEVDSDGWIEGDRIVDPPRSERIAYPPRAEGRDWHRTRDGAIRRVNAMRAARLRSLQRQIDKLTDTKIEVPE